MNLPRDWSVLDAGEIIAVDVKAGPRRSCPVGNGADYGQKRGKEEKHNEFERAHCGGLRLPERNCVWCE